MQEWFNLCAVWNAKEICYKCHAKKDAYLCTPNRLEQETRRDLDDFVSNACRRGEKSYLHAIVSQPGKPTPHSHAPSCPKNSTHTSQGAITTIASFHPQQVKMCAMHSLNLGFVSWASGSCLQTLIDLEVFGGRGVDTDTKLSRAWRQFLEWAKTNKIPQLVQITHFD